MTQDVAASIVTPGEKELVSAVTLLKISHPSLGQAKLLAQLKTDHPTWAVSEKRMKKILQSTSEAESNGTTAAGDSTGRSESAEASGSTSTAVIAGPAGGEKSSSKKKKKKTGAKVGTSEIGHKADGPELIASTGIDPTLDPETVAPKAQVKMFDAGKGKGLVAREKIEVGEVVWQEEPWIACPDPGLQPHLSSKQMCTHCLTLFPAPNPPLSVSCPHCSAHFCNRLCHARSRVAGSHLDLLCPGQNPGAAPLAKMVRDKGWRALDVVARIVAKWRGEREKGKEEGEEVEKRVWKGMARVDIQKREKEKPDWAQVADTHQSNWTTAHALLKSALNPSPADPNFKSFQTLISARPNGRRGKVQPLTEAEENRWFGYQSFRELLGMANINMEDSGGLYALHAHLNHSCEPNLAARNLPKSFTPPTSLPAELPGPNPPGVRGTHKLTLIARHPVLPGDELTISYVNRAMPRDARREALREGYGFWCVCARCEQEKAKDGKSAEQDEVVGEGEEEGGKVEKV